MRHRALSLALCLSLLLLGCWDRVEVEDQLFVVVLGVDHGSQRNYRVTAFVPIASELKAGMLGGQGNAAQSSGLLIAEADSIQQAVVALNASVTRRITLRQIRLIVIGEALARDDLQELFGELQRHHEIRETAGFVVARGEAGDVLKAARFTGESNPARIGEGVLLIEKHLHQSPPSRLHHITNRASAVGVDAFAAIAAINPQVMGTGPERPPASAVAGELARYSGNPVEIAGTALFQNTRLVGYLSVDETQALLALRGEMGKAYITIPNPRDPNHPLMLRFGQENKPKVEVALTSSGPRIKTRLVFEAEVISGDDDFSDTAVRQQIEEAAGTYMDEQVRAVVAKMTELETDPVGFGLRFRGQFRTFQEWERFGWRRQLPKLKVQVETKMRIRRVGLTLGTEGSYRMGE